MDVIDTDWLNQLEMLASVAIATVLGGIVGVEREFADRPAGVRTHALLGAASCLLVVLTDTIFRHGSEKVEGLTTAASLLLVAATGVAVALKQVILAVLVTVLALVILRLAGILFSRIER